MVVIGIRDVSNTVPFSPKFCALLKQYIQAQKPWLFKGQSLKTPLPAPWNDVEVVDEAEGPLELIVLRGSQQRLPETFRDDVLRSVGGCDVIVDGIVADMVATEKRGAGVRGFLLIGPPGSGKSHLAASLLAASQCPHFRIDGSEPQTAAAEGFPRRHPRSWHGLLAAIEAAAAAGPAFLHLEQVEAMGEQMVAELRSLMLRCNQSGRSLYVFACNNVPATLLGPELIERRVRLPLLDFDGRLDVLRVCTQRFDFECPRDVALRLCAMVTNGHLPSDLDAVVRSAALAALGRGLRCDDLEKAARAFVPAALRGQSTLVRGGMETSSGLPILAPDTPAADSPPALSPAGHACSRLSPPGLFSSVGGFDFAKRKLQPVIEKFRSQTPLNAVGMVLEGAPGTGKTHLAASIAAESHAALFVVLPANIMRPELGKSEQNLRDIFRAAAAVAPAVILLESIDSWAVAGQEGDGNPRAIRRVLSVLLSEMDILGRRQHVARREGGKAAQVMVLATANDATVLDQRLLTGPRLKEKISLPEVLADADRKAILELYLRGRADLSDQEVASFLDKSAAETPSEIVNEVREAAVEAVRRSSKASSVSESSAAAKIVASDFKCLRAQSGV